MTTWFTGDWHLGHTNIIRYCNRPFKDVTEMNSSLINNINELVMPNDRIINLGDVAFKGAEEMLPKWLARINCKDI